ncbi:hypothetical protein R6Q57_007952 [Mikania cordata]
MDSKSKARFISTSPEPQNLRPGDTDPVTTKLQLAHHHSAAALDKDAVLRRIRYHKCLRKVKGTFESMANGHSYEKWSEPIDFFTSP